VLRGRAAVDDSQLVGALMAHVGALQTSLEPVLRVSRHSGFAAPAGLYPGGLADDVERARAALARLDTSLAALAGVMRARAALGAAESPAPAPDADALPAPGETRPYEAPGPPPAADTVDVTAASVSAIDMTEQGGAAPASDQPEADPPVRVVMDLADEFGPGWTLTEFADELERGRYQVRRDREIVGVVQRRRSLSGRSTSGWDAIRHGGIPVTTGTGKGWASRGMAAAAIIDAHQRSQGGRRPRRRASSKSE
jgi:hypothetical protein